MFRYVPLGRVDAFLRAGWLPTDALRGTHHGAHAVLMQWLCACAPTT